MKGVREKCKEMCSGLGVWTSGISLSICRRGRGAAIALVDWRPGDVVQPSVKLCWRVTCVERSECLRKKQFRCFAKWGTGCLRADGVQIK